MGGRYSLLSVENPLNLSGFTKPESTSDDGSRHFRSWVDFRENCDVDRIKAKDT
jgi:ABC-type Fe2+-enterobactin transport system substrate-binding protein